MKYTVIVSISIIFLSQLVACGKSESPTPPKQNPTKLVSLDVSSFSNDNPTTHVKLITITPEEEKALKQAILDYLTKQNSPMATNVEIKIEKREGDFVRVHLQPVKAITDAATAFVEYQHNQWQVISVGTAFELSFYLKNGIPQSLWLEKQK